MSAETPSCEIRAATVKIEQPASFLAALRRISHDSGTHIICFNAGMIASRKHVLSAVAHAVRSFETGRAISNTVEIEALLYASGSRQCSDAAEFGVHAGENRLWVCCFPAECARTAWSALEDVLRFVDAGAFEIPDPEKRERLIHIFGITEDELRSIPHRCDITDLVLERVALLDATK